METKIFRFDSNELIVKPGQTVSLHQGTIRFSQRPSRAILHIDGRFELTGVGFTQYIHEINGLYSTRSGMDLYKRKDCNILESLVKDNKLELLCGRVNSTIPDLTKTFPAYDAHQEVADLYCYFRLKNVCETDAVIDLSLEIFDGGNIIITDKMSAEIMQE